MRPSNAASPGRRQQQASAYSGDPHTVDNAASATSVELYRSLVFGGSVPLCICLCPEELPAGSDRSIDSVYLQVPRISYLPLLIPEIRKSLLDLVLDENETALLKENNLWLECEGEPLKWHWPVGLIHDFLRANKVQTQTAQATSNTTSRSYFQPQPSSSSSNPQAMQITTPLRVRLHLLNPPLDKLFMQPSRESCKANFMSQIKEADFVRWGSVRRITSLRKMDQDALWDGVVNNDFQKFWSIASKLVPNPPASVGRSDRNSPVLSTTSTFDAVKVPDANTMRSVPMRVYLPHGAPIVQDVVPATNASSGRPATLQSALSALVPALAQGMPNLADMSASFISHHKPIKFRAIVQGIELPLDTELGWCSSCLSYPDGWLGVVIAL